MKRPFCPRGFVVLLVLLCLPWPTQAALAPTPPLLAGRVLDVSTGEPVPSAHLYLAGVEGNVVVSDAQGTFEFHSLAPGDVSLSVSHIAYQTQERSLRIREGQPQRITILLEPRIREIAEPLLVTASREPMVQRIDSRTIDESNWEDVGDAVRTLPGVLVYEEGGTGGRKTVSVRGSKPDHVRVRVDGVLLNDGQGEAVDLGRIPLEGIESIEIHPATRPGAPGGVVEITTRGALTQPFRRITIEGSQPEAISFSASAGQSPVGIYLQGQRSSGKFAYTDETGREATRINNHREQLSGLVRYDSPIGRATRLRTSLAGNVSHRGSPGPLYQPQTPEAKQAEEQARGEVSIEHGRDGLRVGTTLFLTIRHRIYDSPAEQRLPGSDDTVSHVPADLEDKDLRAGVSLNVGSQMIPSDVPGVLWNVEAGGSRETFESIDHLSNGVAVSQTQGTVERLMAHTELNGELQHFVRSWKWRGIATGRLDLLEDRHQGEQTLSPEQWTTGRFQLLAGPRAGVWSLHASIGNAVAPAPFTSRFLIESVFSLGNPSLKPERVEEISAGVATRGEVAGLSLAATLDGFRRMTRDLVVWRRNFRGQYFPDNVGRAEANGLVFGFAGSADRLPLDMGASLTVQQVRNRTPRSSYEDNWIPFQPAWYGNAHLSAGRSGRLRGTVATRFSGRRYTTESNLDPLTTSGGGLPAYGVLDLSLERSFPLGSQGLGLTVRTGIDNVTGQQYELLDRMPMPGRVYRVALHLENRR